MKRNNALYKIRKLFPKVKRVRDATQTILVNVIDKDSKGGQKNNPEECALAHACVREKIADAAIIGIGFSWLIKGTVATRYKTSMPPSLQMGTHYDKPTGPHKSKGDDKRKVHHTANIRTVNR